MKTDETMTAPVDAVVRPAIQAISESSSGSEQTQI